MSKKVPNRKKYLAKKKKDTPINRSYLTKDERKKAKSYDKLERKQAYGLTTKLQTILYITLLLLLLITTAIQTSFLNKKLDAFTSELGEAFTIKTSLQHQWVFKGDVTSTKKFDSTTFNMVSYKGDPAAITPLIVENKARGTYLLTDDKDTLYLLLDTTYKIDKTVISKLFGFKDSSQYALKDVLIVNKDLILIVVTTVSFTLLLLKSIALLLIISFISYLYSRMRYKDLLYAGIFYATFHSYLYAFAFNVAFGLLFKTPLDFSIIITVILVLLYVKHGKRIIPTTKLSYNPLVLLKRKENVATNEKEKKKNTVNKVVTKEAPQNIDSIVPKQLEPASDLNAFQNEAKFIEEFMKQELNVDTYDENSDLAAAYHSYQKREKKKEVDELENINNILNNLYNKEI